MGHEVALDVRKKDVIGTYSGNLLNVDRLSVAHRLNVTLNDECSLLCMTKILLFKCRKRLDVVFSDGQMRVIYQVFTVFASLMC